MAADDIYHVQVNLEAPSGAASFGLYYQETVASSGGGDGVILLGDAFETLRHTDILDCLCVDWKCPSVVVRKMVILSEAKYRNDIGVQTGLRAGTSLPANNAMLFHLNQATFPARSNGKLFVPGLSETDTTVGVMTSAFLTGPMTALATSLVTPIAELSAGTGVWTPGVISAKVRDAAPPFKDWDGAFAPLTSITPSSIIATQRRRRTKVNGISI